MTGTPTADAPSFPSRPRSAALAAAVLIVTLAGLWPGAALALAIVGPSTLSLPQYCMSNAITYKLVDAGPNARFDHFVGGATSLLNVSGPGPVVTLQGNPDGPAQTWTLTARDDTGAVATKDISYVPTGTPYFLPGVDQPGIQCHNYYANDLGIPYTYGIVVNEDGYNSAMPVTRTFSEHQVVWVNGSLPTISTVLSIPRGVYSTASYSASDGPYDRSQAWSPDQPWARVTASYDAIFPYPTPDRVLADGGTRWNFEDTPDPPTVTSVGVWPRGIDYADSFSNTDFSLTQQVHEGYLLGWITPTCQNTQRGVFIGPYTSYCVFPLDYDAACHHYDPNEPVITSSCRGRTSSPYTLVDVPQPWPNFSLRSAWYPTAQSLDPSSWINGTTVTKVFAAPNAAQLDLIDRLFKSQGIDLSTFHAVPLAALNPNGDGRGHLWPNTGSSQVVWELDGRRTFFCDAASWQSSKLLASAPYLLNGVYCDDNTQAVYPPPATAVGDPYATNGLNPAPTGGTGSPTTGSGCPVRATLE